MEKNHRKMNKKAVSAVIGVIIMVAITVAMAAVAYAYFTGMIGEQKKAAPAISFTPSASEKSIVIATADVDINWQDINISIYNSTSSTYLTKTGIVDAGDTIFLETDPIPIIRGTVTVTFIHVPTNSLIGTFTFDNV
jgi:flagellin-like protein